MASSKRYEPLESLVRSARFHRRREAWLRAWLARTGRGWTDVCIHREKARADEEFIHRKMQEQ